MKVILHLILLVFSIYTLQAQKVVKSTLSSNFIKINLTQEESVTRAAPKPTRQNKLSVLRFLNPGINNKTIQSTKKVLVLKGYAYSTDGSAIKDILVNDSPLQLKNDDTFEEPLILAPGKNLFVFKTITFNNSIDIDTLRVDYSKQQAKNYILQIAINDYEYWPTLKKPISDSDSLTKILVEKYNYKAENVYKLMNDKATEEAIYKQFKEIISELTEHDNLLIIFAGHGHYDKQIKEGYWIPSKAKLNNPADYFSNSDLLSLLKPLKTKHTLVISDACFSGSLFAVNYRGNENVNYANFEKRKSRWAFTSGSIERVSDESIFMSSIIAYLKNNNEPKVLLSELSNYVIKRVGTNSEQMPKIAPLKYVNHEGGQFVFTLE